MDKKLQTAAVFLCCFAFIGAASAYTYSPKPVELDEKAVTDYNIAATAKSMATFDDAMDSSIAAQADKLLNGDKLAKAKLDITTAFRQVYESNDLTRIQAAVTCLGIGAQEN